MIALLTIPLWVVTIAYVVGVLFFLLGLFFPKKGFNRRQYTVSVVIAARNEERNIERLLRDLVHQTYPKEKYEVVVVDDGSIDRTREIVGQFAKSQRNFVYMQAEPSSTTMSPKKSALNQGIRHSSGEIILTTDADCRVRSTWIEAMVSCFSPRIGMVVGFSQLGRKHDEHTFFEKLQALDFLALMSAAAGTSNLDHALAASGQNLAYRRCVFEEVGGYKSIRERISGDDVLFLQLVRGRTSWRICFANSHRAFNASQPEKNLHRFYNQRVRWASNGAYQAEQNPLFFAYVLTVFLFNFALLCGALLFPFLAGLRGTVITCFGVKALAELLLLIKGGLVFDRFDLVRYFPIWTILEIPYVVLVGLIGTFGNFTWKGRAARPNMRRSSTGGADSQTIGQEDILT